MSKKYYHFSVRRWVAWSAVALFGIGAIVLANLAIRPNFTSYDLRGALMIGGIAWIVFVIAVRASDSVNWEEIEKVEPQKREWKGFRV